jgi:phage-related protein
VASSRELSVRITGDPRSLSSAFRQVGKDADSLNGHFSRVGDGLKTVAKAAGVVTAAFGAGLVAVLKNGVEQWNQQAAASAQTAAVLKSTSQAANVTQKQIEGLASALQMQTGIADDAIQSGENLLLTFRNIRNEAGKGNDIFNQTTKIMLDMSVAMHQDMKTSAIQLGKALNDPVKGITALTRVGVTFSAAQKKAIKDDVARGNSLAAQKIILAELNKEFGGSAVAAGKTLPGQLEILKRSFENVTQAVAGRLIPVFTAAIGFIQAHMPQIQAVFNHVLSGIQAAMTPVVSFFQARWHLIQQVTTTAFQALGTAWRQIGAPALTAVQRAMASLGPPVVATLRALGTFFRQVFSDLAPIVRQMVAEVGPFLSRFIAQVLALFRSLLPVIRPIFKQLAEVVQAGVHLVIVFWNRFGDDILGATRRVFNALAPVVKPILAGLKDAIEIITDLIQGHWGAAFGHLKDLAVNALKAVVAAIKGLGSLFLDAAKGLGQAIWNGITGALSSLGQHIKDLIMAPIRAVAGFIVNHWPDVPGLPGPPGFLKSLAGGGSGTNALAEARAQFSARNARDLRSGTVTRSVGGFLPGTYQGVDTMTIRAAPGEVILNPAQQRLVGIDRIVGALRATGGVIGGDGFASGGIVNLGPALAWGHAHLGDSYSQKARLGPHSWDCSSFAGQIASMIPGSRISPGGWTGSYWAASSPAKGSEPVLFGFTRIGQGPGGAPGHMFIKVGSEYFNAHGASSHPNIDQSPSSGATWRVPAGLENLSSKNVKDESDAGRGGKGAKAAAAAILGAGKGLASAFRGTGAGVLKAAIGPTATAIAGDIPGALEVPSGLSASAQRGVTMAGVRAANAAARLPGATPDSIRAAKELAIEKATEKALKAELKKVRRRKKTVAGDIKRLRQRIAKLSKGMPRKNKKNAAKREAVRQALGKLRAGLHKLLNEQAGLIAFEAEIISQAQDMMLEIAADEAAPSDDTTGADLGGADTGGAETSGAAAVGPEPPSPEEAADAALAAATYEPPELDAAINLAALTPGTEDDIAAYKGLIGFTSKELDAAVASNNFAAINILAPRLKGLQDAMDQLTGAVQDNTDAQQQFGGTTAFSYQGQDYVLGRGPTSDRPMDLGVGL